jgi:uridine kinase
MDLRPIDPKIIAIAGGSCSGKSTLARYLCDSLGAQNCRLVCQDDYYHDIRDRGGVPTVDFDVPEALDFTLLRDNLLALKAGEPVALPRYDFTTHERREATEPQPPRPFIVVEGILLLDQPELREVFDHSFYMMCAPELRLSRRLARDIAERGRTREDVLRQFHTQVEPAHRTYVSPSQAHADLVIDQTDYISDMTATIDRVLDQIGASRPTVAPRRTDASERKQSA